MADIRKIVLLILFMFFVSLEAFGQYDDERLFFSYERFYDKAMLRDNPPEDGLLQREISRFLYSFAQGIYAISAEDWETAKKHLKKARDIWPEYFGPDFLLARIYEDTGEYDIAARYYKTYLNKLRSFWQGDNRISESLIKSITSHNVENYVPAEEAIKKRLAGYGIELDEVRPIYSMSPLLKEIFFISLFVICYVLFVTKVRPYLRKRRLINSAPERYWICPECETENTTLQKECSKCRKPAPEIS